MVIRVMITTDLEIPLRETKILADYGIVYLPFVRVNDHTSPIL